MDCNRGCECRQIDPNGQRLTSHCHTRRVIGAPPLLNDAFTTEEVRRQVLPDILAGKKFIALAISEAFVGSDVRGMRTWAKKQPDGSYVVNGQKKWITGGMVGPVSLANVERDVYSPLVAVCGLFHDRRQNIGDGTHHDAHPTNGCRSVNIGNSKQAKC